MKKNIFMILIILPIFLCGCSLNNNLKNNTKTDNKNSTNNTSFNQENYNYTAEKTSVEKPIEETLYSFSTQILDKDSGRQNNISLTCSSLNGTIVESGSTFSFCDTVGKALPERGYQKAKIFDEDGNVTQGYGGGNCQVSSTLYNVVLQDTNFEVVERHPHAQKVYYVESGKDAAVACGSVDFKFKNNNPFNIRIDASTDGNYVYVNILRVY